MRSTFLESETRAIDEKGEIDRNSNRLEASKLETYSYGPGISCQRFSRLFDIVMMGMSTPIDTQGVHLRFAFTKPLEQSAQHALYADGFRDEIVYQVGQDIPIWENKIYRENPVLCDGDGPIAKYRRWFSQFYAGSAP